MSISPFKVSPSTDNNGRARQIPRIVWMIASLLSLTTFTLFAFTQSPRPDPVKAGSFPSLDWWHYPVERNSHKRLPEIKCDLNAISASAYNELIWAVGNRGMIVHSEDSGQTWVQQKIEIPAGSLSNQNQTSG